MTDVIGVFRVAKSHSNIFRGNYLWRITKEIKLVLGVNPIKQFFFIKKFRNIFFTFGKHCGSTFSVTEDPI
jgi:hypothetical protein